ncbi:MAG: protein translocase subunit SecD [Planctomycetes bacterium]|nr:protein translocase subunit SecD [Planctomycetota bacterium]
MNENLGKKITLIVVLAVAAILCLVLPEKPFRLGLDLQGGTRVVLGFDFDEALRENKITAQENANRPQLLQEMKEILRQRVDPTGVLDPQIRPEGSDRIVVEIPGVAELASTPVTGALAAAIDASADTLTLNTTDLQALKAFPQGGADITIGKEKIHYTGRQQNVLSGMQRGVDNTEKVGHEAGEKIDLLTTDEIITKIMEVGDMRFLLGARAEDITRLGSDLSKETQKVQDWAKAHPGQPIDDYNRLAPEQGGPVKGLHWYPHRVGKDEPETPMATRLAPLVDTGSPDWVFTGENLDNVGFSQDRLGYPAVAFEISQAKKGAFGDFTSSNLHRGMAIVLNSEIVTLATINSKLPGSGIIEGGAGGFSKKEVQDLVSTLRSGSLRIRPTIEHRERVGATLGEESVRRSFYSSLVALGLVIGFMLFFYHRLGRDSVVGLLLNLLYLMGAMAFLRATLTLPGVAGLILTLGMAVDGNILLYERLREEIARGLKQVQAAKSAFERAAVTIIDANVTTLIAGIILYIVGTGPIKGFATTLNIGILTTLFTVIVVTEVLIFNDLKKGKASFKMRHFMVNPGWPFMRWSKPAIAASLVVIVAGMGLFISMPDHEKLGIDFTGGFTMTVRTEQPRAIEDVRGAVAAIPGTLGRSATVVPLLESGDKQTGYRSFRITYKLEGASSAKDAADTGLTQVQAALADMLEKGPVEVGLTDNGAKAKGRLHLEDTHSAADVGNALTAMGLKEPTVTPTPNRRNVFDFEVGLDGTPTELAVTSLIDTRIRTMKDSNGAVYHLASNVPESSSLGPQVGSELRDKAVMAVLLSLVGTMFYVRIRFAEYAYGIAVVISLLHDVFIALGALALASKLQILQAEVDLSMIAAFLTIIGYSQNDTIVIFDRVRENRQKSNKPLTQILDDSINECFGRTILTTSTVVITLLVLFLFNVGSRNVLEGFSYCMLVGVISGAYSTIYVASPVFLWLERRAARKNDEEGKSGGESAKAKAALPASH